MKVSDCIKMRHAAVPQRRRCVHDIRVVPKVTALTESDMEGGSHLSGSKTA